MFDDKGVCTTQYTVTLTGVDPNLLVLGTLDVQGLETKKVETAVSIDDFIDDLDRVVPISPITREQAEENVKYMLVLRFSADVIRAILNTYPESLGNAANPETLYVPVDDNDHHAEEVAVQFLIGGHVTIEGGQSVGKNTLAESIAKILNMPSSRLSCKADMTSDDWFGGKTTDNTAALEINLDLAKKALSGDKEAAAKYDMLKAQAASVKIVNEESAYLKTLQNGGVIVLDEWNMCDPNLASAMVNPVTDKAGRMFVPGRGYVTISPKCFIIATQNPRFAGTQEQNQATTSRFGIIELGYPKSIINPLKEALKNDNVPNRVIAQVNKLYIEIYKAYKDGSIASDAPLNIRGFIRAILAHIRYGANLRQQIIIQVVNNCAPEVRDAIVGKVNAYFE